ncbi:hypothetical protein NIIDNTM18_22420 [Mycolicibacterium litorale]|uniref:PE-PGRS family protein n=1 Tax=Mycolicibacterium litorale TaxID=758802 RepID=A0A6S6P2J8_9MYCO|nr:hypothetical protein [Mycolicibacterium litorale]BCI52964.1 hypothetical protein NIIDNTM18_22420 [Mycolicibacterium litorale]
MYAAIRPRFATGLAVATAGIIAVSPLVAAPQVTAPSAVTAHTVLTAIDNPFPLWDAVNQELIASLQELAADFLSRPAPILTQIARNQVTSASELAAIATEYVSALGTAAWQAPERLNAVVADLLAGDVDGAVRELTDMARYPVTLTEWLAGESFPILVRPIDRLIAVAAASPGALNMMVDAVMVAASTFVMSAVGTVDDVWHALKKQDFDRAVNAVLTGAAIVPATAVGLAVAPIQGWIQASRFLARAVATTEGQHHDPVTPTLPKASFVTLDVPAAEAAAAVESVRAVGEPAVEEAVVEDDAVEAPVEDDAVEAPVEDSVAEAAVEDSVAEASDEDTVADTAADDLADDQADSSADVTALTEDGAGGTEADDAAAGDTAAESAAANSAGDSDPAEGGDTAEWQ